MRAIQEGDRVAYSATFLRSIGCQTGPACFVRGVVTAVRQYGGRSGPTIATVRWDDPAEGDAVNVVNLVRVADMHMESAM